MYFARVIFGFAVTLTSQLPVFAGEYRACANIPATGQNCAGEKHACGEGCVKCGSVSVGAPTGQKIVDVKGYGSDRAYWAWEQSPTLSGATATGKAKNWSHDQALEACILLKTE